MRPPCDYVTPACKWQRPLLPSFLRTDLQPLCTCGRGSTAPLCSSAPNSHSRTHSPETQLSISPNRLVSGIARLRFLNKALFCCIVKTPTLTCARRHRGKNFYTLFIRDATNNWLRVFPISLWLQREESERYAPGALTLI